MVASDFNVLKDCKMRVRRGSTQASNNGQGRLFKAQIKLSGSSTHYVDNCTKIGPNLSYDLGAGGSKDFSY